MLSFPKEAVLHIAVQLPIWVVLIKIIIESG